MIFLHPCVCAHCTGLHYLCHLPVQTQDTVRKLTTPDLLTGGGVKLRSAVKFSHVLFTRSPLFNITTTSQKQLKASLLNWQWCSSPLLYPRSPGR